MALKSVLAGQSLQTAINNAVAGDILSLEAGATFTGPISVTKEITIQSSRLAELPPDVRVSPADAGKMPRIITPGRGEPALQVPIGTANVKLLGIELAQPELNAICYDLVRLGDSSVAQNTLEKAPHHIVIDRCYIHAHENGELKRGVALNSAHTDILNSYISGFKVKGQEAQAVAGWNGPGPFRIINTYLEGAGENFIYGGALPFIPNLLPADLEMRRCHLFKPPSWKGVWTVKNILELKTMRRAVIDGNIFDGNWLDAQQGYSILFTVRPNDSGSAAVIEDVEFTNNIIRNVAAGLHLLGQDDLFTAGPKERRLRRVRVANNLWEIDHAKWGGDGCFAKIVSGTEDVTIDRNTVIQSGNIAKIGGDTHTRLIFTNNIIRHNEYGFHGDNVGAGNRALTTYAPGARFERNVIAKEVLGSGSPSNIEGSYPPNNLFPAKLDDVLDAVTKEAKGVAVGLGVDWVALRAAQAAPVVTPTPTPTPTPQPSTSPGASSPDGTKATSIVDASGARWTLGPEKQTLRNGVQVGGGAGVIYKYISAVVYVLGTDNRTWFKWSGSTWVEIGATEPQALPQPTPAPTPTPVSQPSPVYPKVETRDWLLPPTLSEQQALRAAKADEGWEGLIPSNGRLWGWRKKIIDSTEP